MIGNLLFAIPFFEWPLSSVIVAAPFIFLTVAASPHSPSIYLREKLRRLSTLTEEGHSMGLVFYSISYTILASLFPLRPYIIATGVLPMAYGDSAAALLGQKFGKITLINDKTLEGFLAMFITSLMTLILGLAYFSTLYSFSLSRKILPSLATVIIVSLAELLSPRGYDNITVPLLGAFIFYVINGGS
jgi:dolichol kinase